MKKQKKDNKESIYRIDYDKTVIFKERVTRFTVRFEFKGKEKEKGEDRAKDICRDEANEGGQDGLPEA